MAERRDGGMAEWQDGDMAEGRNGGMVFYYILNLSCYIYGTTPMTPTTPTTLTTPTAFKSFRCTEHFTTVYANVISYHIISYFD